MHARKKPRSLNVVWLYSELSIAVYAIVACTSLEIKPNVFLFVMMCNGLKEFFLREKREKQKRVKPKILKFMLRM